jgi:electron transport complex protein RnfD
MMWAVVVCLLPAALWGTFLFGVHAAAVLFVSIATAVLAELVVAFSVGRNTLSDGSAVLTGLLLGMSMPPGVPLFIPVLASVFAIVVVKWTFGGLGKNWMNPALAGRVFVFFSWTGPMTNWQMPRLFQGGADAVSGATILGLLRHGVEEGETIVSASAYLRSQGFSVSDLDRQVTAWLNERVLEPLNVFLPQGYVDPFIGIVPGSIGETSALLLLLGTLYLWFRRILRWEVSLGFFGGFSLFTWVFGGLVYGSGWFSGDVLLHVLSGGFLLVMFYMANDPVTRPMTKGGMLVYGIGAGILTFALRFFGSFPEGVALAVLLMNVATPLIDRFTRPRLFGMRHAGGIR